MFLQNFTQQIEDAEQLIDGISYDEQGIAELEELICQLEMVHAYFKACRAAAKIEVVMLNSPPYLAAIEDIEEIAHDLQNMVQEANNAIDDIQDHIIEEREYGAYEQQHRSDYYRSVL